MDFKEIFLELVAAGAGRPIDKGGVAVGQWTPDLLAEELSRLDGNKAGVDLRSVQNWFQQNDKAPNAVNIGRLAKVFGCGDPEATGKWRVALIASHKLLVSRRRRSKNDNGRASDPPKALPGASNTDLIVNHRGLAARCEWLLSGQPSINLLVCYWLVFGALGLMNYALGTLSVTYSPHDGLDKQVGFIWAPTLTVLPLVVLPLYILSTNNLISFWKNVARPRCALDDRTTGGWLVKVKSFTFSFWAIVLFSYLFVFGFQWALIYLPAYMSGDTGGVQVDRYLVALFKPEVITIPQAMVLSAFGYHYTASYIAVFLLGLLFMVILALDFSDVCSRSMQGDSVAQVSPIREDGNKVIWGCFRLTAYALWLATLIKLQIVYLSSDGENFVSWLGRDALGYLGLVTNHNGWLDNSSVSHFTTFLMMAVTVATFGFCILKVLDILTQLPEENDPERIKRAKNPIIKMSVVITILCANLLLVGRFEGFSLLVASGVVATIYAFTGPKLNHS